MAWKYQLFRWNDERRKFLFVEAVTFIDETGAMNTIRLWSNIARSRYYFQIRVEADATPISTEEYEIDF